MVRVMLATAIVLFSCQESSESQVKIDYEESEAADEIHGYHYAKYRFSSKGYKDVMVALRVSYDSGQVPKVLELKDLTAGREARAIEEADLKVDEQDSAQIKFSGTSELKEGEEGEAKDYGGSYAGKITLGGGGATATCCGEMKFVPTNQPEDTTDLTFTGTKQTPSDGKDFDEDWWNNHTGTTPPSGTCDDYQVEVKVTTTVGEDPVNSVTRGNNFNIEVKLKNKEGTYLTDKIHSHAVHIAFKYGELGGYQTTKVEELLGKKLEEGQYIYSGIKFSDPGIELKKYRYQATVIVKIDNDDNDTNDDEDQVCSGESEPFNVVAGGETGG